MKIKITETGSLFLINIDYNLKYINNEKVRLEFKLRILNWLFIFPIRDSDSPTAFPDENFDLGGQFILCIWDGDDGFLHLVVGNGHIWTSIIVVYSHVFLLRLHSYSQILQYDLPPKSNTLYSRPWVGSLIYPPWDDVDYWYSCTFGLVLKLNFGFSSFILVSTWVISGDYNTRTPITNFKYNAVVTTIIIR